MGITVALGPVFSSPFASAAARVHVELARGRDGTSECSFAVYLNLPDRFRCCSVQTAGEEVCFRSSSDAFFDFTFYRLLSHYSALVAASMYSSARQQWFLPCALRCV